MMTATDMAYGEFTHFHKDCPFCSGRECLKPSVKPLPFDGSTVYYCTVNRTPVYRIVES